MLDFFIDKIFVQIGELVFQQMIGIPMGMNCAPLLVTLFLHAYEADFLQVLITNKHRKKAQTFDSWFCYKDDVQSPNNSLFSDYPHLI